MVDKILFSFPALIIVSIIIVYTSGNAQTNSFELTPGINNNSSPNSTTDLFNVELTFNLNTATGGGR